MANKSSDSIAASCKQSRNERIEEFLREHYAFRYNTVKSRAEFRSSDGEFLPVTKYRLNSFRRELDRAIGISTSAENLRSMLESDFSERVNPVQAYFINCRRQRERRPSTNWPRPSLCATPCIGRST